MVKQNNGYIEVYSEQGQGTTFNICLPHSAANVAAERKIPQLHAAVCCSATILLVEDELAILRMTTIILERLGYTVLAAPTPYEAILQAKERAGSIDLVMTDVVMPEMNGSDLAKTLLSICPDMRLLFMSGYTANVLANQGVLEGGVNFIQKPFSSADLREKLSEVLHG
jgi:CheY-like chemotaxis protein